MNKLLKFLSYTLFPFLLLVLLIALNVYNFIVNTFIVIWVLLIIFKLASIMRKGQKDIIKEAISESNKDSK